MNRITFARIRVTNAMGCAPRLQIRASEVLAGEIRLIQHDCSTKLGSLQFIQILCFFGYSHGKREVNRRLIANQDQPEKVSEELEVECYFAKPYHSWERGANENLNGLVRQYFPKGMNFGRITEQRVNEVVDILNQRPRKRFGFRSPEEVFQNATLNNEGVAFIT